MVCMAIDRFEHELLVRRDAAVWDSLYMATCRRTYRVLHYLTGERQAILEDLNQDVWLSAIESIASFDASLGTAHDWVLGIARYKGLTYLRKQYRNRVVYVADPPEISTAHVGDYDQVALDTTERLALLRATIESLPENWQSILRQKYDNGMSVKEIAELAGTTSKAVESTLSRARTRLRELFNETIERSEHT